MKWIGLIILGYLMCLLATLPIATLTHFLPLPVVLGQPSGTLWSGEADSLRWQDIELSKLHWQLRPLALLTGKAVVGFEFGQGSNLTGRGLVSLSPSGWQAEDIRLSAPLALILERQNVSLPVSVEGDVELRVARVQSGAPWCEIIDGQVFWLAAGLDTPLGRLSPGRIVGELGCAAGKPELVVNHQDTELELQAHARLLAKSWQFEGKLHAGPDMETSLIKALAYVGKQDSQGYYHFDFDGRF